MKQSNRNVNNSFWLLIPEYGKTLVNQLLPPRCHGCRGPLLGNEEIHICAACREKFLPICSPLCTSCGIPFTTAEGIDHLCGDCLKTPPRFTAARAAYVHDGPIKELIHRFKYDHQVRLRRPLGQLTASQLGEAVASWQPDLLVPVPLYPSRLRERGFNQAILLGTLLAQEWQIPLIRTALSRIRWTVPQIELHHDEREANVRGAFAVTKPTQVAGRRILLVDDVLTTGSTVAECARMLRLAKASEIFVVAVARALKK